MRIMQTISLLDELRSRDIPYSRLAQDIGVHKSRVTRWAQTGVPPERVLDVERITGISRHDLRPDVFGPAPASLAEAS